MKSTTIMEKEIREIPQVLKRLIENYFTVKNKDLTAAAELIRKSTCVHIVGCGTAYHAGLALGSLLESKCKIRTKCYIASEIKNLDPFITNADVGIAVSQSGETTDTINAMEFLRKCKVPVIAMTNVDNSTIARLADINLPTLAGPEIAIASTKAYCAQVMLGTLLVDTVRPSFSDKDILALPRLAREAISRSKKMRKIALEQKDASKIFFLGSGLNAYSALESSLKIKETTYMHCEGFPTNEIKHGPLSMVDDKTFIIAFNKCALAQLILETGDSPLSFIYSVIPVQFFAMYLADAKGLNPDKPRNLVKAVTD